MAVPTPPQAFWSSGDEGTPDRLNWTLLQADTLGNRPAAHADINGVVYLATSEIPPVLYQVQSGSWVSLSAIGGDQVVRKTADQTVNGSTSLVNDTHLLFALAANEVWVFTTYLLTNSGATPDLKFTFTVPASAVLHAVAYADDASGNVRMNRFGATTTFVCQGDGSAQMGATIEAIVINSTNTGNCQLQWAQNTSDGSDSKVLTNSLIVKRRIL
jgi:hypothetical protein